MKKWPGDAEKETTSFGELTRGQLMSRVRSKGNATTELLLAKMLRQAGLAGWRRHLDLLGRPDFAWPDLRVTVFVDGCFWHGHECGKNIRPKTNAESWRAKIEKNKMRDRKVSRALRREGWSVLRIWECNLRTNPQWCISRIRLTLLKRTAKTPT